MLFKLPNSKVQMTLCIRYFISNVPAFFCIKDNFFPKDAICSPTPPKTE